VHSGEWIELTKLQSVFRALRHSRGWSLEHVADELGWSVRKVWLLETSSITEPGRGTTIFAMREYAELLGHRIETRVVAIENENEDEWRRLDDVVAIENENEDKWRQLDD
jgi:transcriptional regulator with XRE-family HTH domain